MENTELTEILILLFLQWPKLIFHLLLLAFLCVPFRICAIACIECVHLVAYFSVCLKASFLHVYYLHQHPFFNFYLLTAVKRIQKKNKFLYTLDCYATLFVLVECSRLLCIPSWQVIQHQSLKSQRFMDRVPSMYVHNHRPVLLFLQLSFSQFVRKSQ